MYEPSGRIFNILKNSLSDLPKTSVHTPDNFYNIHITNRNEFVPDFVFSWDNAKGYYRVYIHIASTIAQKSSAGYCICVIRSVLVTAGFVMLYQFLHKHRANNKSSS